MRQIVLVAGLMLKDDSSAYLWIYDTRSAYEMPKPGNEFKHENVPLKIAGFKPGEYEVEFWNTYTGDMIERQAKVVEANSLSLTLPAFENDVAVKVKKSEPQE